MMPNTLHRRQFLQAAAATLASTLVPSGDECRAGTT